MNFVRRIFNTNILATHPKSSEEVSFEPELESAMVRTRNVQNMGFDVSFAYLPQYPDAPPLHVCVGRYQKYVALGSGYDSQSRGIALAKSLSETVERALWYDQTEYWNHNSVTTSPARLGGAALSLDHIAGFSPSTRKKFPKLYFDDTTPFRWSPGIELGSKRSLYIPSQLVSARYVNTMGDTEPLLRELNSNGLATADSFDEAAYRGLLELVERDAFMITYFNSVRPTRIDVNTIQNKAITSLLEDIRRFNLACDILLLPTDAPTHVVCAVVRDTHGGPAFALGAKAHHYADVAVTGALVEALATWTLARFSGKYLADLPTGSLSTLERVAYWAKPENASKITWFVEGESVAMPKTAAATDVHSLANALRKLGCTTAAIELSTPLLKKIDIHSVCVISPELQPINLESSTQYDFGTRLRTVPEKYGFRASNQAPSEPQPFP